MNTKVLKAYMEDCRRFGWNPSFAGANAYDWLVRHGFRRKWTAPPIKKVPDALASNQGTLHCNNIILPPSVRAVNHAAG